MRKIFSVVILLTFQLSFYAHEGMWIPSLLKAIEDDMQAEGLKLSAEDIYSINKSSLKDCIVHFGGGCTAEIVSKNGLILTNHHCGLSQIQSHSSTEHDYIKDGFWAKNYAEELKNPGLTATLIVRIEDVTDKVLKGLSNDADEMAVLREKYAKMDAIAKEAVKGTKYEAIVKPFYYGNKYYMIVTKTYKDVRLVGAPPAGIGKFGGDTDNWVWPRHTGDFSVFRIYADEDNQPAEIGEKNKPYTPDNWLKIDMRGVKENDFTMVFGFPGRTSQYLSAAEVDDYINILNPARIAMRTASLSVINAAMLKSDKTRIQYTSKQARISNAHKKWIGQNLGLKEKGALDKKLKGEADFQEKVKNDKKYNNVLADLAKNQEQYITYDMGRNMFIEIWYYGPEILRFAHSYESLLGEEYETELADKKEKYENIFKNYNATVDKNVFKKLVPMYLENLDHGLRPSSIPANASEFEDFAEDLYEESIFADEEKLEKFFTYSQKKQLKVLNNDPAYQLAKDMYLTYKGEVEPNYYKLYLEKENLMQQYLAGLMEYNPKKTFFADANSTLRLTYGKIEGSSPRDGMKYTYYTTMDGIIQKNNTGAKDFEMPERMRKLWEAKDYGPYATDGELRVCLLGSNHTTGGNSGSPALNGEGYLIGINFDRSWESTMSDIMFDPSICRNIMVDIKYVLWVIDKFAGADHLIDEMDLVMPETDESRLERKMKDSKNNIKEATYRLRDDGNDIPTLFKRAESYQSLDMNAEFLEDLNQILKLDSKNVQALNYRAKHYEEEGNLVAAEKDVNNSLKINSKDNAEAYFIQGVILAKKGKYEKAISSFNACIAQDYTLGKAYYNRGVCEYELGNNEAACKNFDLATKMGAKNGAAMYKLNCDF